VQTQTLTAQPAELTPAATPTPSPTPTATVSLNNPEDKPVFFKGVGLEIDIADSSGLNAVGENYQNDWLMVFLPTWRAGAAFFKGNPYLEKLTVSGRFVVSGEFSGTNEAYRSGNFSANSFYQGCESGAPSTQGGVVDTTAVPYCQNGANRRADYSDISLRASDTVYTIPKALVDVKVGAKLGIPISLESRNQGLILNMGAGPGLSRSFLNKKLHVAYDFSASKYFFKNSVGSIDYNPNGAVPDPNNPGLYNPSANTLANDPRFTEGINGLVPSYAVSHAFTVGYDATDKLSFTALYWITDTFARTYDTCNVNLGGTVGTVNVCQTGQAVAQSSGATVLSRGDHGSQRFLVDATYAITDYLAIDLSLLTDGPQRHPDGSWQEPFIETNYNGYTSIALGLNFNSDILAGQLLHPH
jgi:hypothetical protein